MSHGIDRKRFRENIVSISKLILPWSYFLLIEKHIMRYISSGTPGIPVVELKVFQCLPEKMYNHFLLPYLATKNLLISKITEIPSNFLDLIFPGINFFGFNKFNGKNVPIAKFI